MSLHELLKEKGLSVYALAKKTGIPYMTLSDVVNDVTPLGNMNFAYAMNLAKALEVTPEELLQYDTPFYGVPYPTFRSEVLHALKNEGHIAMLDELNTSNVIDRLYKAGEKEKSYFLVALYDYLADFSSEAIDKSKFDKIRREKLSKVLFVGQGRFEKFDSVEEVEKSYGIHAIPQFANFNIVEVNLDAVA